MTRAMATMTRAMGNNDEDINGNNDNAVPVGVATECSQNIENDYSGGQHQVSILVHLNNTW